MRLLKWIIVAILGALALITGAVLITNPKFDVAVTQAELQERITSKLPVSGSRMTIDYTVMTANVELLETGQMRLGAGILITRGSTSVPMAVDAVGRLTFSEGAFYLDELEITDLSAAPIEGTRLDLAANLTPQWIKDRLAEEARTLTETALITQFTERPIYQLPDSLVNSSISDVTFGEELVMVTIDPLQIGLRIGLYILTGLLLVGLVVTAFKSPNAFAALAFLGFLGS